MSGLDLVSTMVGIKQDDGSILFQHPKDISFEEMNEFMITEITNACSIPTNILNNNKH